MASAMAKAASCETPRRLTVLSILRNSLESYGFALPLFVALHAC
jgi:hypothetical protein